MAQPLEAYWSLGSGELLSRLQTSDGGLSAVDAARRIAPGRPGGPGPGRLVRSVALLFRQFASPIVLILISAAVLSFALGDRPDAFVILSIIAASGILGFLQERSAGRAVEALLSMIRTRAEVLRDGARTTVPTEEVVAGDIVFLSAGDTLPGDCLVLDSKDLFVDESALTGETYPVEKGSGAAQAGSSPAGRSNALLQGTHVISGSARAVVALTGSETEFGRISRHLRLRPAETEFQHGIRKFGNLLVELTLLLVVTIFAVNVFLNKPVLDSLLFSLALAVGLTPQLLPAIISVNLARGARVMGAHKVIVRRLVSIENFGSMNVLCSDKTGTLTEGRVRVDSAFDIAGGESERVLTLARVNAAFETGLNPIDSALRSCGGRDLGEYSKLDEIPYDFGRKRLSILASREGKSILVAKGALQSILGICSTAETPDGAPVDISQAEKDILGLFESYSRKGYRTLGVAYRDMDGATSVDKGDEKGMVFAGLVALTDPPKEGIEDVLAEISRLGIDIKIITGDNAMVAESISREVGFRSPVILTGRDLREMKDEALVSRAPGVDVFAEIEPNQKERIVGALKKAGKVVGYVGDGINDASALHAADVGISVDSAVDVAKEAADIVLLEKDLEVLVDGIREGRRTFANTMKYVFMATSANFGNMFSMAGASLFLPFLPLLPKQILLMNLLTDLPEMAIATDNVDPGQLERPHPWDMKSIRRFMLSFGLLSSVFDYLTFGVLLFFLKGSMATFRAGWFTESVVSAALVVLVVRTRLPFFRSGPGRSLTIATFAVVAAALLLPLTPLAGAFELVPLQPHFLAAMAGIVVLYVFSAELLKRAVFRKP